MSLVDGPLVMTGLWVHLDPFLRNEGRPRATLDDPCIVAGTKVVPAANFTRSIRVVTVGDVSRTEQVIDQRGR
ncbi:MAG TPA: hypothetical protein VNC61_13100 [Acidimicrobiales bacterium]|nr:hypothetical protein [Acidimicrobiales bacterium]